MSKAMYQDILNNLGEAGFKKNLGGCFFTNKIYEEKTSILNLED